MATPSAQKRLIARLILLALLFGVVWFFRQRQQAAQQLPASSDPSTTSGQSGTTSPNATPAYVIDVLKFVRRNGQAPDGYVGGKEFQNREKHLPAKTPDGQKIHYSEWDVRPKVEGQNRGPERLVTGSDHSAWYSKDHYKSFHKIE